MTACTVVWAMICFIFPSKFKKIQFVRFNFLINAVKTTEDCREYPRETITCLFPFWIPVSWAFVVLLSSSDSNRGPSAYQPNALPPGAKPAHSVLFFFSLLLGGGDGGDLSPLLLGLTQNRLQECKPCWPRALAAAIVRNQFRLPLMWLLF